MCIFLQCFEKDKAIWWEKLQRGFMRTTRLRNRGRLKQRDTSWGSRIVAATDAFKRIFGGKRPLKGTQKGKAPSIRKGGREGARGRGERELMFERQAGGGRGGWEGGVARCKGVPFRREHELPKARYPENPEKKQDASPHAKGKDRSKINRPPTAKGRPRNIKNTLLREHAQRSLRPEKKRKDRRQEGNVEKP